MARRTIVTLLDDLDPAQEAGETVSFGLDRVGYEIDLSDTHATELRDTLAGYVRAARKVGGRVARRRTDSTRPPGRAGADREQSRAMREWARRQGMNVSDRGRIPATVIEAYHSRDTTGAASHSDTADTDSPAAESATTPGPEQADAPAPVGRDGLTGPERETIRAWALEEGIDVKPRGLISRDLIGNYRSVMARRAG